MKTNRIEAVLNIDGNFREINCIQLGALYVYADKTNKKGHLIYGQKGWVDDLRRDGYDVNVMEEVLDVRDSIFNELDLKHYELKGCEIYLFPDLAVKIGSTLDIFCKEGMTVSDAIQKWGLQAGTGKLFPDMEYAIPKNMYGKQAVEIEKLSFDIWDCFLRGPGETVDTEERLEEISVYYQELSEGKNIRDLIQGSVGLMQEVIGECNEQLHSPGKEDYYDYYIGRLKDCEFFMDIVKRLLGMDKDMDGPTELSGEEMEEQ